MTVRAKRTACWIITLAVLVCLPLACGPSGDDVSDLEGIWVNVKGLEGRPVVVRFNGYRGRLTIGTFFVYKFRILRAVRKGARYTLTIKGGNGRRSSHDLVRPHPDRIELTAEGIYFVFRRLKGAEAARYRAK
jgi:hypothetical protein